MFNIGGVLDFLTREESGDHRGPSSMQWIYIIYCNCSELLCGRPAGQPVVWGWLGSQGAPTLSQWWGGGSHPPDGGDFDCNPTVGYFLRHPRTRSSHSLPRSFPRVSSGAIRDPRHCFAGTSPWERPVTENRRGTRHFHKLPKQRKHSAIVSSPTGLVPRGTKAFYFGWDNGVGVNRPNLFF